jgi:hypothetical protein
MPAYDNPIDDLALTGGYVPNGCRDRKHATERPNCSTPRQVATPSH